MNIPLYNCIIYFTGSSEMLFLQIILFQIIIKYGFKGNSCHIGLQRPL